MIAFVIPHRSDMALPLEILDFALISPRQLTAKNRISEAKTHHFDIRSVCDIG
jgi:hypothetical protein